MLYTYKKRGITKRPVANTLLHVHLLQPRLTLVPDSRFLLMFLRAKKFSQLASRELLEMYLERRQQFGSWFQDLDPSDPKIQGLLDSGSVHIPHQFFVLFLLLLLFEIYLHTHHIHNIILHGHLKHAQ